MPSTFIFLALNSYCMSNGICCAATSSTPRQNKLHFISIVSWQSASNVKR